MRVERADMMDAETKRILEKVQACFNQAASTPFEAEAETAVALAHAMLLRHDLEMADLSKLDEHDVRQSVIKLDIKLPEDAAWQQGYHTVAVNLFCTTVRSQWQGKLWIIGRPTHIEAAVRLTKIIMLQLEVLAMDAASNLPMAKRKSYRLSFLMGGLSRMDARLKELNKKADNETAGSQALVLVMGTEVQDFVKQEWPRLTYSRGVAIRNDGAWHEGYRRADQVGIHQPVEGANRRALPA